jgi:hypothetical protein
MAKLLATALAVGLTCCGEANAEDAVATFDTRHDPERVAAGQWNTSTVGLFCGSEKVHGGRIVVYAYGISEERLGTGEPLAATFVIDSDVTELKLKPLGDLVLAPVKPAFVGNLLRARSASVSIKDYRSPYPEQISLDGADRKLRSALKKCYRF